MQEPGLILTLAAALGAALVFGYLTQRLGLSPIVGYLIAGVAIGPHTPGFIGNAELAEQLAEIGVILLMFGVGLQLHVEELLAVRRAAVPGAAACMSVATLLGALAARGAGWTWTSALVFGLTLSVASTVVLVRVLSDARQLHTSSGHIAVGWLVIEDVITVVMLVLLPALVGTTVTPGGVAASIGAALLKVGVLVALAVVVGVRAIPRLLDLVVATRSRELFTLMVLVLALGIAVTSTMVFGVSMALGAFIAGLTVGRSDYSLRAATEALPMREAFAVLFFVSIGMLLDPLELLTVPWLTLAALVIVVFAKPIVAALMLAAMRYPLHAVLTVPSALAQIGEFSFILAALARDLGVLPEAALDIVVAVSIGSIVINPLVSRAVRPVEQRLMQTRLFRGMGARDTPAGRGEKSSLQPEDRAVVIGYGPTGRTVARLLRENGIAPTIIDLNLDTVRALRQEGVSAVYGDARDPDTLVTAGVRHAATLIVSGADSSAPEAIRAARELNPAVHVFARGAYLRDVPQLRRAGAEHVFSGEGEVALAMTEAVLRRLGATPDQIDRERHRVHGELLG
ncbi:MAG: sodium:proton exchanger [Acidobacteria bacterium RIFCSPLOWO2_12_FULL_67_14]|nr:MAG: sodium:proton exchanger [Acidobacteria bacterium RIFCSPLOWO2_02_FULL_67_21]OFW38575.1 MAG: sodium:proton exchanger [Acidobacteria bacterium RIFCSPLOWO2_12_FULL_67_14]